MSVPAEIPEIGSTGQRLAQNPRFDPMKAGFGTEEYFVWSRFDGATTVKDLILMTGLPVDRAVTIVRRLRVAGAILLPGETSAPTPAAAVAATASGARVPAPAIAAGTRPPTAGTGTVPRVAVGTGSTRAASPTGDVHGVAAPLPELGVPTADEAAALAEACDLSDADRRRILVGQRLVAAGDPWALLGVSPGADKRTLKRAFFERSKLFHPDRYFGRQSGSFKARLHEVFEAVSRAHDELTADGSARRHKTPAATAPQTPAEYAAELFDRACVAEVSGDHGQALKLFAAAVKLDPQARYLRRAASCALAAGELRAAEDFAKKAAAREGSDPSTARILARVLRALGKLDDAEEVLVMALAMKNENDVLGAELAADLRTVRDQLRR